MVSTPEENNDKKWRGPNNPHNEWMEEARRAATGVLSHGEKGTKFHALLATTSIPEAFWSCESTCLTRWLSSIRKNCCRISLLSTMSYVTLCKRCTLAPTAYMNKFPPFNLTSNWRLNVFFHKTIRNCIHIKWTTDRTYGMPCVMRAGIQCTKVE